jgi:hypothetical protein
MGTPRDRVELVVPVRCPRQWICCKIAFVGMDVHGCAWMCMDVHGCAWMCMGDTGSHGATWRPWCQIRRL